MKNKYIKTLIISLVIFFIGYYLFRPFLYSINLEYLYLFTQKDKKANNNIIVVEIDDLTYNKLGFPLDRGDYIPFLQNLYQASPAVIGFDILFADEGKDKDKDLKLAETFKKFGNIVLGFDIKNNKDIIMPYDLFYKSIKNVGYFKPIIDLKTNKVYSLQPFSYLNNKGKFDYFESFSFSILREYYNYIYNKKDYNIDTNTKDGFYNFFDKKIPLKNQKFFINYLEPSKFERQSFYNIYNGNFNKDKFKDKIVLIGYTAQGVKDDFFVPGIEGGVIKGVYVHANVINNILNENYVVYFNEYLEGIIYFLFVIFIVYLNTFFLKNINLKWISFGTLFLFIFISIIYLIIFFIIFQKTGIYLIPNYPFQFILILFLSFFASSVFKYITEDKNKRLLSKALSEYVSSDIVREILHSTGEINLAGENKKITIFFSDIAGFTTISEKLSPEDLVSFLRVYLGNMSNIIIDNKGFINKYEGDAIMALWGVFGNTEKYGVIDACKACLLQQRELKILNKQFKNQGKFEISVRMGLHCGNAIIGNIGSEGRKMEFTALGDSVNLASRLEGVNKFYNTNICVSEDVFLEAKDLFEFRYLDKIRVKGKNLPINIYELICFAGELSDFKKDIIKKFNKGIELYSVREFSEALNIFKELEKLGDGPSSTYAYRCQLYIKNPPEKDWDLVWSMNEK